MKKEITLRKVLEECLEERKEIRRLCSKDYLGMVPKEGMEDEFDDAEEKCRVLRELLQAIKSEPVLIAIANWEQESLKKWQKAALANSVSMDDLSRESYEELIRSTGEERMRF